MRKTTAYARKRAHQDAWQRTRHEACNPVTEAVVRQHIEGDIQRLRTEAGLQTYIGGDAARIANMAGRLVYVVCHAAGHHGLGETPEARMLDAVGNGGISTTKAAAELLRQHTRIAELEAQLGLSVLCG